MGYYEQDLDFQRDLQKKGPPPLSGLSRCQCSNCGELFNSVTAFDLHRIDIPNGKPGERGCLDEDGMLYMGMSKNFVGYWITQVFDATITKEEDLEDPPMM